MIKKSFILITIVAVAVLFSCGKTVNNSRIEGGKTYVTEGWIDGNTFQVKGVGVPKKGLTNKYMRQETAKEAALIGAQKRIIEKFKGAALIGASGMADAQSTGIAVAKEFSGFVKGGSIKKVTFDKEQNCEVVYWVRQRGLKNKVTTFMVKK